MTALHRPILVLGDHVSSEKNVRAIIDWRNLIDTGIGRIGAVTLFLGTPISSKVWIFICRRIVDFKDHWATVWWLRSTSYITIPKLFVCNIASIYIFRVICKLFIKVAPQTSQSSVVFKLTIGVCRPTFKKTQNANRPKTDIIRVLNYMYQWDNHLSWNQR